MRLVASLVVLGLATQPCHAATITETFGSMLSTQGTSTAQNVFCDGGSDQTAVFESASATSALIGPFQIVYTSTKGSYFYYGGIAKLSFKTATTGVATADVLPEGGVKLIDFTDYAATSNTTAKTLTISLTLALPDCSLPIQYIFHTAP